MQDVQAQRSSGTVEARSWSDRVLRTGSRHGAYPCECPAASHGPLPGGRALAELRALSTACSFRLTTRVLKARRTSSCAVRTRLASEASRRPLVLSVRHRA